MKERPNGQKLTWTWNRTLSQPKCVAFVSIPLIEERHESDLVQAVIRIRGQEVRFLAQSLANPRPWSRERRSASRKRTQIWFYNVRCGSGRINGKTRNPSSLDDRYIVGHVPESSVDRLSEYDRLNRLKRKMAKQRAREFDREHGIQPSSYELYMQQLREIPSQIREFWRNRKNSNLPLKLMNLVRNPSFRKAWTI